MKSEFSNARLDKHPHFCIFDQQLKMTDFFFFFFTHTASSSFFPQGSVDLLITGSEVHYQCVHCQPSWLGLDEGHTDLIRLSWVLITSWVERLCFHQCCLSPVVLAITGNCDSLIPHGQTDALSQLIWFLKAYLQSRKMNQMMMNRQTQKIAQVLKNKKLLFTPNGSAMTFYNNKVHCCSAETAEYGCDDIHSCCHRYGHGNFASQLCTLAGNMNALQKAFLHEVTWEKA